MIINCPKCKTKYSVNQNVLNKEVKCSECSYIWIEKKKIRLLNEKKSNSVDTEANESLNYRKDIFKEESRKKNYLFYFIFFLILTLLIFFNFDFLKKKFVLYFSEFTIEKIFKENSNNLLEDLIFNEIEKEISVLNDNKKVVKIFGKIINKSNIVNYDLPMLKATLFDSKNNILSSWEFSAENRKIAPEETVIFNTSYIENSEDISDIKIEFLYYDN
tara:strand:+ start:452 stop:1102 length:651 start_codon:yes stop_codon:yes gene_type:complete